MNPPETVFGAVWGERRSCRVRHGVVRQPATILANAVRQPHPDGREDLSQSFTVNTKLAPRKEGDGTVRLYNGGKGENTYSCDEHQVVVSLEPLDADPLGPDIRPKSRDEEADAEEREGLDV